MLFLKKVESGEVLSQSRDLLVPVTDRNPRRRWRILSHRVELAAAVVAATGLIALALQVLYMLL